MKYILMSQREQIDQYNEKIDVLEAAYITYFTELGYFPITVSNFCVDVSCFFDIAGLSAVVLTGGGSVPAVYYDNVDEYVGQENRDRVEMLLMKNALKKHIPVLGICRGMQFINGYMGGKVSQLIFPPGERKNGTDHSVICEGEKLLVNNYHNDGIYKTNLAEGLIPVAEDTEYDVVEAFRSCDNMILGIQWHPERKFTDEGAREKTKSMIRYFISRGGVIS